MKFNAIVIDPPVPYIRTSGQGVANRQYTLMTWDMLHELGPLIHAVAAPDCAIFLWVCPPLLVETLTMVQAWKLRYITKAFCWAKLYPAGGFVVGLGSHTRANTEDVWLLSNGTPRRKDTTVLQIVPTLENADLVQSQNTRHSKKPEEVQTRIEKLVHGPYLELFARRQRPGWTCIGNEIDGLDISASLQSLANNHQPEHRPQSPQTMELTL